MRRNRILCLLLALVMLFVLASGCSASRSSMPNAVTQEGKAAYGGTTGKGTIVDSGTAAAPAASAAGSGDTGSSAISNSKLIKTATIQMESLEFDKAMADLKTLTQQMGGYFEQENVSTYSSGYRSGRFIIRVPAEKYDAFCDQTDGMAHVTNIVKGSQNIGEQYYDVQARLATQQTKYERLLALLEKAATMQDIIALETAISDTELQIERLTGTLRNYDSLVGFSSITVQLTEVFQLSNRKNAISFGERLQNAVINGLTNALNAVESIVIFLTYNLAGILILAVIIVAVVIPVWRRRRRSRPNSKQSADEEPKK